MEHGRLPNVWGPGALFTASGYDCKTDFAYPFVGRLTAETIGVEVHCEASESFGKLVPTFRLTVEASNLGVGNFDPIRSVVLGDRLLLCSGEAEVELICLEQGTYFLRCSHLSEGRLRWERLREGFECVAQGKRGSSPVTTPADFDLREHEFLLKARYPDGWRPGQSGTDRWEPRKVIVSPASALNWTAWHGDNEGFESVAERRRQIANYYDALRLPDGVGKNGGEADGARVYAKAASILKLNVESPQDRTSCRWTTPDKFPHRHMWLWDSGFHALGWKYIDETMALDAIRAVLERVHDDGFLPITMNPFGDRMIGETQPPILGWTLRKSVDIPQLSKGQRRFIYDKLTRFIDWIFANRSFTSSGLLGWRKDEESKVCRSGESGWDNSTRFDHRGPDDNIDMCSYVAGELEVLESLALGLGMSEQAASHADRRSALIERMNEFMWCEEDGLYYDVNSSGEFVRFKTAACFLPLLAGVPGATQAQRLAEHLLDPETFLTRMPVPTMAPSEPAFEKDMWRGPSWMNSSYLIIDGLRRYGLDEAATEIAKRIIREVERWYEEIGCIMEYYDCQGAEDPRFMLRKGSRTKGIRVIRDYGWSAAVYIALKNEFRRTQP